MSHNGFLCALPTSLIEAIPLGIVSGWASGVTFLACGLAKQLDKPGSESTVRERRRRPGHGRG
eukprot:5962146-Pyramimonas_sp.AAC.1